MTIPSSGDYAGIVSRGIAFLVDGTIAVVVCTAGYELVVAVLGAIELTSISGGAPEKALGYVLALPVVFGVYCAGSWTLAGRTAGMALLGLRVVRIDGDPPGARRSVVRAICYWLSAILLLGFIWIAFDRRHQGFHDKCAGTVVVYDWPGRT